MTDPVTEVEEQVERIIAEHAALWGCDDPACAVRTSNMLTEIEKPRWWQRFFLGRRIV